MNSEQGRGELFGSLSMNCISGVPKRVYINISD